MYSKLASVAGLLLPLALPAAAFSGSCSPGGNFDLSVWTLQLPSGTPNHPTTIFSKQLEGCNGHQDQYFFTDHNSGQLVMKVPGSPGSSGCVSTSGSEHCRTEFRENNSWEAHSGTHTLTVTTAVTQPDDGPYGTAIGQVFGADADKPLAEMFYSQGGDIVIGVNKSPKGGDQAKTKLGHVPVGSKFTYVLAFENGALSATINGKKTPLNTYSWGSPKCYFKTGNYNQGSRPSEVHISAIEAHHS